jgi:hypothetical protein
MSIVLTILAVLGIVLGSLLALLLLVPVHLRAAGVLSADDLWGQAIGRWGWGAIHLCADTDDGVVFRLFGFRIDWRPSPDDEKKRRKKDERQEKKQNKKQKRRDEGQPGQARAVWRSRRALLRMVGRLLGTLHLRLWVEGVIGLGEPDRTVALDQCLQQIDARTGPGLDLDIWCDFHEPMVDLEAVFTARVWLIETLVGAIGLLLQRETRTAIRALRGKAPARPAQGVV